MDFFQLKLFEIFFTFFNFFFWLPAPSPPEKLDTWPTLRRMNEHLEAKKSFKNCPILPIKYVIGF